MYESIFVVIHFGSPHPTVVLANSLSRMGYKVAVIANDRLPRAVDCDGRVIWIVAESNLGYAGALNLVASQLPAEIYIALNNDIVIDAEAIDLCLSRFRDPRVGVVGPRLEFPDGRLQSGAGVLRGLLQTPDASKELKGADGGVQWLTGAVLFVRSAVLESIGFDSSYFLGYEDTDLCIRAAENGWRIEYVETAVAIHEGGRVIGHLWYYYASRNRVWFSRTHASWPISGLVWLQQFLNIPRVALADAFKGRGFRRTWLSVLACIDSLHSKPLLGEGPLRDEPRALLGLEDALSRSSFRQ